MSDTVLACPDCDIAGLNRGRSAAHCQRHVDTAEHWCEHCERYVDGVERPRKDNGGDPRDGLAATLVEMDPDVIGSGRR